MKTSEIQTRVLAGEPVLVGKYLGDEVKEGVSTKSGQAKPYVMHFMVLLCGMETVHVSLPTAKGISSASQITRLTHKKDTVLAVSIRTMERKFGCQVSGTMSLLEP